MCVCARLCVVGRRQLRLCTSYIVFLWEWVTAAASVTHPVLCPESDTNKRDTRHSLIEAIRRYTHKCVRVSAGGHNMSSGASSSSGSSVQLHPQAGACLSPKSLICRWIIIAMKNESDCVTLHTYPVVKPVHIVRLAWIKCIFFTVLDKSQISKQCLSCSAVAFDAWKCRTYF